MPYPGYTGWTVVIDDPLIATGRTALDINNPQVTGIAIGTSGGGATVDWGTAQITEYLAQQGKYGSSVADYVIPNRTITIPIGVGMDVGGAVSAETALRNLSMKVGTLQREGGWLRRQRKGGPNLYADIVDAQLTGVEEWMETANVEPNITLTLTCLPDFYGDEIALDTIHCTGFCTGIFSSGGVPANIQGDYPARCRILIANSGIIPSQYGMTWGVLSRDYTPIPTLPTAHPTLVIFAAGLYSSFAGTALVSDSGSYNGQTLQVTLPNGVFGAFTEPLGPATPNNFTFSAVGTFNVWARCNVNTGSGTNLPSVWLEYFANGSSSTVELPRVMVPKSAGYYLLNLGPITIPSVPPDLTTPPGSSVPPYFNFALLASSPVGSQTLSVDVVFLQPTSESAGNLVPVGASTNPIFGGANTSGVLRTEGVFGYGQLPLPSLGDLLRIPPSGLEGRPVQLFLKPSQAFINSLDGPPEDISIDTFTVQPNYRPCYLTRP